MAGKQIIEITHRWLMDTAGWAAVKEGKRINGAGAVEDVDYEGGLLKGIVKSAGRPRVAGLRILGRTDVENLCHCSESRRSGGICGHSAAIALSWIEGPTQLEAKAPPVTTPPREQTGIKLGTFGIRFEASFLEIFQQKSKCPVKFQTIESDEAEGGWEGQTAFQSWLGDAGLKALPPFVVLAPMDAGNLFKVSALHYDITFGKLRGFIPDIPVRMPLKVEPWGDAGSFSLSLGIPEQPDFTLLDCSNSGRWMYREEDGLVTLREIRLPDLPGLREELGPIFDLNEDVWWIERDAIWLAMHLEFLSDAFLVELSDLPAIPTLRAGDPDFELHLEGSLNHLEGELRVSYSDDVSFIHGKVSAREIGEKFPFSSPESADTYTFLRRDLKREKNLVESLKEWGLGDPRGDGNFLIKGRSSTLRFYSTGIGTLKANGLTVTFGERFTHIAEGLTVIRPEVRKTQSGNWSVGIEGAGGISETEVRRYLASGRHEIPLKDGRTGVIDISAFDDLAETLKDVSPEILSPGVYRIPPEQEPYLYQSAAQWTVEELTIDEEPVDLTHIKDLNNLFRDYQRAGFEWLARGLTREGRGAGALLADEMGLGKTLQTLAVIKHRRADAAKPSLVICPTSLIENWRAEAEKFTPDLKVLVMHGSGRAKYASSMASADLVITSYALIVRDYDPIYKEETFDIVALDEAGYVRNPKTQTAKTVCKLEGDARLALTGTPVENSLRDLWSIFQFAVPGYLGSYTEFRERYEKSDSIQAKERLRRRLAPYMLRRTKREVAKDLPDRLEKVVYCIPSDSQRTIYNELQKSAQPSAVAGGNRIEMLTALLRLRQTCCDPRLLPETLRKTKATEDSGKLEALREILAESIEGGHRVLIFSQFVSMLSLIRADLEKNGIAYQYLDGSSKDRGEQVRAFQTGQAPVFLISLKAGGYGLNLTAADTVIHFDPWWNPAVEAQATDRAHRIGQQNPVTSYKLIMRGTVEEKILKLQDSKREVIDSAIDDFEPQMTGLSESELLELITG